MKLYFVRANGERKYLSQVFDNRKTILIIKNFLDEHNFKSYYTRIWYNIKEHELWFDVGSHVEFFVVTEVDTKSEFYKSFFFKEN